MYPGRGVLHTPYKCPHRGQTNSPIWIDRPICIFVLTPSIPESFIPNDFRSLPGSFVGRMQYAPTLPNEKRRSQNVFVMLFETQNRVKMFLRCFLRLKINSKCFWGAFWGSKLSQNVFDVFFEDQNRVKMFLRCFLRLKMEPKCFWGAFWGSKWSESVFEVLFEAQNGVKVFLRSIFCIRWR